MNFKSSFLILFGFAVVVRLYHITAPLADWHSFRQADTASVTREYVKHGISLLRPTYHDLSNIQSGEDNQGKDNVDGLRMVEFPIINAGIAFIMRTFQLQDVVVVSRLASIAASLITLSLLVYFAKNFYDEQTALWTGVFFAFFPYAVYYSRVILPEPFLLCFGVASFFAYWKYLQEGKWYQLILAFSSFALALLIKPMAVFMIPAFIGLRMQKPLRLTARDCYTLVAAGIAVIPLILWRQWIQQFPLGIPSSNWLYNGGGEGKRLSPVYNIRFRPAWFRWLFYERVTKLILGFTGIIPFVVGLFPQLVRKKFTRSLLFIWMYGFGLLLYFIVFAAGNVQHDYYQVLLLPFLSLTCGLGIKNSIATKKMGIKVFALICVSTAFFFSYSQVHTYYNINNPDIITAGKRADVLLAPQAKVIAPYNGDTAFLFQTNRTGWPIGFAIDKKIEEGATAYISVVYDDEARDLEKKYVTIEKTSRYIIFDLQKPL